MKPSSWLAILFFLPMAPWALGSYFSGLPSLADLDCRSHPTDPELKFCVRNSDSDVPPSLNYEEYIYIKGELTMVIQAEPLGFCFQLAGTYWFTFMVDLINFMATFIDPRSFSQVLVNPCMH